MDEKNYSWEHYHEVSSKQEPMVRVCTNCGTVYSETTRECVSCSQKLGSPMTMSESEKLSLDIRISQGSEEPSYEMQQMKKKLARSGWLSVAALGAVCAVIIVYIFTLFNGISVPQAIETPALMVVCAMLLLLTANLVFCFAPEAIFRSSDARQVGKVINSKAQTGSRRKIIGGYRFGRPFAVFCTLLPVISLLFCIAVLTFYILFIFVL